jgi:hypothetical protein
MGLTDSPPDSQGLVLKLSGQNRGRLKLKQDLTETSRNPEGGSSADAPAAIDLVRRRIISALLASGALAALSPLLEMTGLVKEALAQSPDLTRDTLNGVAVFFVPGPDPYSVHQGESTPEPGGLETGAGEGLYQGLNFANPFVPNLATVVAGLLNATALAINPAPSGPFASAFSNLSFAEKGKVFELLEGNPASAPLAGVLPAAVGFLAYAETAVFDPVTRTISGRPIGWDLSSYTGVSDGRDEFRGYFRNRRRADA